MKIADRSFKNENSPFLTTAKSNFRIKTGFAILGAIKIKIFVTVSVPICCLTSSDVHCFKLSHFLLQVNKDVLEL